MNTMTNTLIATALLLVMAPATAAQIPACSNLPSYVREANRNMAYCVTTPQPVIECGRTHLNLRVFNNDENRLPRAGRGQTYYEGRAQRDPGGQPGAYRLVFLVTDGRSVIEERYYSPDHYDSFCSIR